jgi:phospholipase C
MRLVGPLLVVIVAAVFATGCGSSSSGAASDTTGVTSTPTASTDSAAPCGGAAVGGSTPYRHVIWVWMENKDYEAVIGNTESAPYVNALAGKCGLATNYHNIAHPSLPNYIAATSGLEGPAALDRFRADCDPRPGCTTPAESIFEQAPSWKAYEESMPGRCRRQDAGAYAVRHNPPLYFTSLEGCASNDVGSNRLHSDLSRDSLPAFSFVTPNVCSDTHDCPVARGDRWLDSEMTEIIDSKAYASGRTAVFITYDEGGFSEPPYCSEITDPTGDGPRASGCRVATVVVSPTTEPGTTSNRYFDHYSLLRTTEDMLGLPPLGAAAGAAGMADAFGLR